MQRKTKSRLCAVLHNLQQSTFKIRTTSNLEIKKKKFVPNSLRKEKSPLPISHAFRIISIDQGILEM
jgi:hypothetical protein